MPRELKRSAGEVEGKRFPGEGWEEVPCGTCLIGRRQSGLDRLRGGLGVVVRSIMKSVGTPGSQGRLSPLVT